MDREQVRKIVPFSYFAKFIFNLRNILGYSIYLGVAKKKFFSSPRIGRRDVMMSRPLVETSLPLFSSR